MSHFVVLVIGGGDLDDRMAPFNEQPSKGDPYVELEFVEDEYGQEKFEGKCGYWHNPNAKWDWYEVGGRWTGYFELKKGKQGKLGRPGLLTEAPSENTADILLKGSIDLESMMAAAKKEAERRYDEWESIRAGRKVRSFEQIEQEAREKGKDDDWIRETYHRQVVIKDYLKSKGDISFFSFFSNPTPFIEMDRERFVRLAMASRITPYAFLKPDGTWVERGEMGWFGMASNEKDKLDWSVAFMEYFHSLPDNTLITVVDCHI